MCCRVEEEAEYSMRALKRDVTAAARSCVLEVSRALSAGGWGGGIAVVAALDSACGVMLVCLL